MEVVTVGIEAVELMELVEVVAVGMETVELVDVVEVVAVVLSCCHSASGHSSSFLTTDPR